ncbi:SUMF1/EgtB/PvdO family nonheme iron enzyme [Coraliomargarita parva]|uniref:SUMF1/EgtB/PvdO family nonheme iron enzyme n=1 Tax=Coraliomargarita parva TaxID=3014050 RepID=UPI0022B31E42|nr:SUMF1/EgtB/PvdO family nonheme iron enzyme [Coraliomargarita parva]
MENEDSQSGNAPNSAHKDRLNHRVLKSGESFGNYRVVRCLCAGLIANYYHMQHVRDLHDVTVGVFHPRSLNDERFPKRLEVLRKSLQGCKHEGIPRILEIARINDRDCIFLEAVKGRSLSQYFAKHGDPGKSGLGTEASSHILAQLLGILGYAHSMKLDHRDLDSDLIFIQEDETLTVLGVGIKATVDVELFESIVSASVSPLVSSKTPGRLSSFDVMSPEYRSGVAEDRRVDIYGAAVVGYWLLTGQKAQPGHFTPPGRLIEGLAGSWNNYFERSLVLNREDRYPSCKLALLGLKKTEHEPESERAGLIQRQIDRIPVPKSILARGNVASRVYRLSVIGVVGLTLAALMASFLQVTYTNDVEYVRHVAVMAEAGRPANLRVLVRPSVAKIEFLRFGDSFIANNGQLDLRVQTGHYTVRVSAPHHLDSTVELTIANHELTEVEVDLKPAWTDFQIISEPGASISVVDERGLEIELGVANQDGVFFLKKGIFAGTYQIIVRKKGFQEKVLDNQQVSFGEVTELQIPLVALPASLTVQTNPSGARVLINEKDLGLSPLTIEEVDPSEHYLVAVYLDGYRPLAKRIEVAAGQDMLVSFESLVPLSGELELSYSFSGVLDDEIKSLSQDVRVELDGFQYRPDSDALRQVPQGKHKIRLQHPLYASDLLEFSIKDRERKAIALSLTPKPAYIALDIPGDLNAGVRLNGTEVEIVNGQVSVPANQPVEFELQIPNHLTMVRRFEMEPTEQIDWKVEPVPIPGPTAGQSWTMPYFGLKFSWVTAGTFLMGSPMREPGRLPNEGPQGSVTFTRGFWMGTYEVTQSQYRGLMEQNPSEFGTGQHPVDSVSWKDAQYFCSLLTKFEADANRLPEGYVYRLPTEAEWEYAARAGTTGAFSFGDEADSSMGAFRGVYPPDSVRTSGADGYGTHKVGSFAPNNWGLYDVHGNVKEWTLDVYNGRLEGRDQVDPRPREEDGGRITVRGGSWEDFAVRVRSAARDSVREDLNSNSIGFRVVLAPDITE